MTRTAQTRPVEGTAPTTRRAGVVRRLVSATGRLLRLLLVSLLVSIVIEWIGMHAWWPELGVEHSHQMVLAESAFLDRNISSSWVRSKPAASICQLISTTRSSLSESQVVTQLTGWSGEIRSYVGSSAAWRCLKGMLGPYARAARNISELYGIRLIVLGLAAPLFVLLGWVGLVDGLDQRDLRRWGGGRESSYVYHYAKRSNVVFVALAGFIYLAMPFTIHPAFVLVPFAIACAGSIALTASRFKKYL